MLTKRIIPALFIKNGLIVRSEDFSVHQIIGNVINQARRYNEWNVDELIYVDISRDQSYDARRDDHQVQSLNSIDEIIDAISRVCFMPLTFGGGIRTIDDINLRILTGADKVIINSAAYRTPDLIRAGAERFGSQAMVISVDYRIIDGVPVLHTEFGRNNTGVNVFDWIKECEQMQAGEIFLHAIDRDGMAEGFDIETIGRVASSTRLPIIACGGGGMEEDFLDVLEQTEVRAVAAGNYFHFTERSYPRLKKWLRSENATVRP